MERVTYPATPRHTKNSRNQTDTATEHYGDAADREPEEEEEEGCFQQHQASRASLRETQFLRDHTKLNELLPNVAEYTQT